MDYTSPSWLGIVQDAATVIGFLSAVVLAVVAVGKYLIVKPLERYIDARTPKNGGKSLGELHGKVDVLTERVIAIEKEVIRLDGEVDHLADG